MAIPHYQTLMLPLFRFLADSKDHSFGEAVDTLADEFGLTEEERQQRLPSGPYPLFRNRVGWARTYLVKAALVERVRRGWMKITERGQSVLRSKPDVIDVEFLHQFPEFRAFRELKHERSRSLNPPSEAQAETPEEALDSAYERLREELESELLEQVKTATPSFFERLVVDLLVRMGYGGSLQDAGQAVGRSGDGGIDGILKEDRLGLDVIYVQAKRWENTVGRPEIQKFAGALQGHRARKGVTTSGFSGDALDYVLRIDSKIILVDGAALAKLMIDHGVGVSTTRSYELKRVDLDYFAEE